MKLSAPLLLTATLCWSSARAFVSVLRTTSCLKTQRPLTAIKSDIEEAITSAPPGFFFASIGDVATTQEESQEQRRVLGSQELLMLPRQYGPSSVPFPQMNHVTVAVLSATPSLDHLRVALENVMRAHPLLHAHVQGDGEPDRRIDLFKMVREGEPNPPTFVARSSKLFTVDKILKAVPVERSTVVGSDDDKALLLESSWKSAMLRDLDDGLWCNVEQGPLWKVELHYFGEKETNKDNPCALVVSFNHAISDQSSANRMFDQILRHVAELEATGTTTMAVQQSMPVSLEDAVLGPNQRWNDVKTKGFSFGTLKYVIGKAAEGLKNPVLVPDDNDNAKCKEKSNPFVAALTTISGRAAGGMDEEGETRRTVLEFRTLDRGTMSALKNRCKQQGLSVSHALVAAVALTATDFIDGGVLKKNKKRNYKILHSLDMRRFGAKLDQGQSVSCVAGSHDLMYGPLADRSGQAIRQNPAGSQAALFWKLAKESQQQTDEFIESSGPAHAVRVFDFAMSISDLNNLVYLTSQSKETKGRAYSAGSTNVGVFEYQEGFRLQGDATRKALSTQHGRYKIKDVFFATPHTQSGCLYPVSCLTVDGELKLTFHPLSPLVSAETNRQFADAFVSLLEAIATEKKDTSVAVAHSASPSGMLERIPEQSLSILTALVGVAGVASHGQALIDFFNSIAEIKANVQNPSDFWAALNFWIFFAVGHPLLQPFLWISDVLHGTPGPKIADLVPVLFLAGNALVIGAVAASKEIRNALNISLLAAFLTYVGAGLEGTAGLGDFNLALDDSYKGQVVKGCPTYEEVRQPSMNNFNLEKYQGLWYEQKFHDWTQFKEVYDTTLSIKLTDDGKSWIDDFAVKGPAPDAAKLSWEKSPVANGAHYFLFGRVDEKDPPGILRESGFGVEFPNYIVDVQKDLVTGEYTEAIQFQCLERGGVRVFEGINFMSRSPVMTEEQLANMHARAKQAGMYPYGASPEQMHTVARKLDDTVIDNSWQAMWRAIGLDKLLELLAESIEDGGR